RVPVVIDLLIGAAGDAHRPAAALLLIDENDAVLLALVDGPGRACSEAGRVEAVLAKPRQERQERVLELAVDVLFEALEIIILRALGELRAEALLPVRSPIDFLHALAGDHGDGARGRSGFRFRRVMNVGVFVVERLVVVVDLRHVRVGKDFGQNAPFAAYTRLDRPVGPVAPAALPSALILPILRIADAGF